VNTPIEPIDHIERWRHLVIARREQHDAVCSAQGRDTSDYWARRAEGFRKFVQESSEMADPYLDCLLRHVRAGDTVLDIGAGTGRHALPLAAHTRQVTALDPSAAMLGFLREDVASKGLTNIDVVEGTWPNAAERIPQVDVVTSAHVLYPIEDVAAFLRALDAKASRYCFLNLMVRQPWFDSIELWEAVHGEPRVPQPTYIDAVNVLHQLGCYANIEVFWVEQRRGFDSLEDAFERFAESVAVGDDPEQRRRLNEALAARLEPMEGGGLASPVRRYPLATVWWDAGALRE
jgi:SAM-dependent methyltransferase